MGNAKNKTSIQSQGEAQFFLIEGPARSRHSRKLNHNTWVETRKTDTRPDDLTPIAVRFYDTDIVTFYASGAIVLKAGGFNESTGGHGWSASNRPSPTTKSRIEQLLPPGLRLVQERYQWYVQDMRQAFQPNRPADDEWNPWHKKYRVPFVEGMLILPDVSLHGLDRVEAVA